MTTPPHTLREPAGMRLCPDCPVSMCSAARFQDLSTGSATANGDGSPRQQGGTNDLAGEQFEGYRRYPKVTMIIPYDR